MEIIEFFDFDYVQCAIYQNKVYTTERCKESHSQRKILKFCDTRFREGRFDKAIRKGFHAPVINVSIKNSSENNLTYIIFEELMKSELHFFEGNEYFDISGRDRWYSTDSIELVRVEISKIKYRLEGFEVKNFISFKTRSFTPIIQFESEVGELKEVPIKDFSHRINICGIQEDHKKVDIDDEIFRGLKYNKFTQGEVSENATIASVKPYYFSEYDKRLKLFIQKFFSGDQENRIIPIKISEDFEYLDSKSLAQDKSFERKNQIEKLYKYYDNSPNEPVSKRNAVGCYLYYRYDQNLSEEESVKKAHYGFVCDSSKRDGEYDTLLLLGNMHSNGTGIFSNSTSPKITTFKEFYNKCLR